MIALALVGCGQILGVDDLHDRVDAAMDAGEEPGSEAGCDLVLPDNVCAVSPQCGCDAGANCIVEEADGSTSCVIAGSAQPYTVCHANCDVGGECIGTPTQKTGGVCKPFCRTDADCPGAGRVCIQITTGGYPNDPQIPGYKLCSAGCDLLNPAGICGPTLTCDIVEDDKLDYVTDCFGPMGTGVGPNACPGGNLEACAVGYTCHLYGPHKDTCAKWCRVGHSEDCTSPAVCTSFGVAAFVGTTEWGTCL